MKAEDFRQIITQAIDGEIEAYIYYRAVSEKVEDKALNPASRARLIVSSRSPLN